MNKAFPCYYIICLFSILCCRYVSPEYANTGMLNERSDVYSFGILLMEIITGRNPVDYSRSRPPREVKTRSIPLVIIDLTCVCHIFYAATFSFSFSFLS